MPLVGAEVCREHSMYGILQTKDHRTIHGCILSVVVEDFDTYVILGDRLSSLSMAKLRQKDAWFGAGILELELAG